MKLKMFTLALILAVGAWAQTPATPGSDNPKPNSAAAPACSSCCSGDMHGAKGCCHSKKNAEGKAMACCNAKDGANCCAGKDASACCGAGQCSSTKDNAASCANGKCKEGGCCGAKADGTKEVAMACCGGNHCDRHAHNSDSEKLAR